MGHDRALLFNEPGTAVHRGHHLAAAGNHRGGREPEATVGRHHFGRPRDGASARVERDQPPIRHVYKDLVAVNRHAAHHAARWRLAVSCGRLVFPEQIAGGAIQRLHDAARIRQKHHAVMHDRRRLRRARLHVPGPDDPQVFDGGAVDLIQRL